MRSWIVAVLAVGSMALSGGPACAFGLGETLGAVAVQGTLAGTASQGTAATLGSVRTHVQGAASSHNAALVSALGASAPTRGGSGATWMTAASGTTKQEKSQLWATCANGIGGGSGSGWRPAEALGSGASTTPWPTAKDAWPRGGILPN